jgi:hypothetical protein
MICKVTNMRDVKYAHIIIEPLDDLLDLSETFSELVTPSARIYNSSLGMISLSYHTFNTDNLQEGF